MADEKEKITDEKKQFAELIRGLIPVNELTPQAQQEFINKANLVKIKKGKFVFQQGDRDDFSYYLLDGEIALIANDSQHNLIASGTDRARYAMAQLQPRQFSAKAACNSIVLQIIRHELDKLLVIQDQRNTDNAVAADMIVGDIEVGDIEAGDDVDWMTKMLQSELFSRMPMTSIQGLFALLEPVEYKAGDKVIKQGDIGEDYYIISEGTCQVSRKLPSGDKEINLAVLKAGDSFGEEALIAETTRNATIRMLTDGIVMKLSKDNFIELIKKPALRSIKYNDAIQIIEAGAGIWLDVRYQDEHAESGIEDGLNIPLNMLRMEMDKLDRGKHYIVYCDTGGRSSTGAFLLAENGFEAGYLEGGLVNNTQAARKSDVTQIPVPEPDAETADDDDDPDIRVSALEAELARTNMQLKSAEKNRQQSKDKSANQMQKEVEKRLQAERAKIETAKKEAEEESRRLRGQEEEKIRQMKKEAEKRMREEKDKLEQVYSRNAEEMEKFERMKQEAADQLKVQKAQLEKEAEQARKHMEEAERIKKEMELSRRNLKQEVMEKQKEQDAEQKKIQQEVMRKMAEAQKLKEEVEAARRKLEEDTARKEQEQQQMERQITAKAREKLEAERRKLAEQLSRNHEELEVARRERAAADAARKAAKEEAERIISEYKHKHEVDRQAEEAKLQAERKKLEEAQLKFKISMQEIEQARKEAEADRQAAQQEAAKLREKQAALDKIKDQSSRDTIISEIREAEEKLNRANREIEHAEKAQVKTAAASKVNEADLLKQKMLEEELSKQLAEDLEEFREELDEEERKFANLASQMEHMKRIKARADSAKQAAKNSNFSLLDEIAAQLGEEDGS
jgi:CRP-like cAMP-binding protein